MEREKHAEGAQPVNKASVKTTTYDITLPPGEVKGGFPNAPGRYKVWRKMLQRINRWFAFRILPMKTNGLWSVYTLSGTWDEPT